MNETTISVIIPSYNRPTLVQRAIQSVITQTCPPNSIIIVDGSNGPPLPADGILVNFPSSTSEISVFPVTNRGPSYARNFGAKQSTAQLLAFLDDDDVWLPDFLFAAERALRNQEFDAFVAGRWNRSSQKVWRAELDALPRDRFGVFARSHGVSGSNLVIRRTLWERLGGYDERLWVMEDVDLHVRLLESGHRVAVHPMPLVVRHVSDGPHLSDIGGMPNPKRARALRRFIVKHRNAMPKAALAARIFELQLVNARLAEKSVLPAHLGTLLRSPRAYFGRAGDKIRLTTAKTFAFTKSSNDLLTSLLEN